MKKKVFGVLCLLSFNYSFAVIPTMDVNVMSKDTRGAIMVMQTIAGQYQQANSMVQSATKVSDVASALKFATNGLDVSKFCPECGGYTISELENYKKQSAKNICEQINNQLQIVQGHMTNMASVTNFVQQVATLDPNNPQALVALTSAAGAATATAATEANQTQQQMASYQLMKDKEQNVNKKVADMNMTNALFGVTTLCSDCQNQSESQIKPKR